MTDRTADAGDSHLLVQASRCVVQQLVLGGLLHDLNGPLNNVALTLALLSAAAARDTAAAPDDPVAARRARHVATLESEVRRLGSSSQAMGRVLHAESAGPERLALRELVAEVQRQLRHHAALHELALEVEGEAGGGTALTDAAEQATRSEHVDAGQPATVADRDTLRFALSALVLAVCAFCAPGARVRLCAHDDADGAHVTVTAHPAVLPHAALDAFRSPLLSPPSAWLHLVAGRVAATAEGAVVSLSSNAGERVVIDLAFAPGR